MTWADVWKVVAGVIISLGGGAAIFMLFTKMYGDFVFSKLLESHRSALNRDLEAHKVKLRKSEFIFQKEYEAASELVAIIRNIMPRQSYPEMDWYDACDQIAYKFGGIEVKLNGLISEHGAALDDDVVDLIVDAIGIAGRGKHNVTSEEVSSEMNEAANDLYKKLTEAEHKMLSVVRGQSISN